MNSKVRCATCKEYFERDDPDAVHRGLSNFCSSECMFAKQQAKKKRKRKNNELPPELRAEVLERDNATCRFCTRTTNLNLHHVRYRSEGGPDVASNLLTLCWEHHALVHSNKRLYQPACLELLDYIERSGSKSAKVQAFVEAA